MKNSTQAANYQDFTNTGLFLEVNWTKALSYCAAIFSGLFLLLLLVNYVLSVFNLTLAHEIDLSMIRILMAMSVLMTIEITANQSE